jgi:hypothetical protein
MTFRALLVAGLLGPASGNISFAQIVTGDGTTVQVEDRNAAAGKSYYRLVKLP